MFRPHFAKFEFPGEDLMAGLVAEQEGIPPNLQCFPVFSLLAALDLPTINLFSLDIEGAEFQVDQTFWP